MLVYLVGPNKSMCNNLNALLVLIMLFLGWVFSTCLPAWQELQSLSFLNTTSFKPLIKSCLTNLFNYFILTWPNFLCHNQPILDLVNKHVDNWASLALKSTNYRFSYLKPLKIKLEPSTLMISTSSTPNMHLKPRSHNWATDNRLQFKLSTNSTLEMLKSLDIVILPSPLILPLPLSPNMILQAHCSCFHWLN